MIDQLQFLRPDWFYAFIPLLVFIALMFRRRSTSFSWKSVCDAALLPHILTSASKKTSLFPLLFMFVTASLCILAASGPVWEKLPRPVFSEQSALVIALDLSQSMDATDISPSRLVRARLKVLDILKARKGGQTALIVYAADAFTVTPLTEDTGTIASLIPSLETSMMPSQGSRTNAALLAAGALLAQTGVINGEILLVTDGVTNTDEVIKQLTSTGHRISILGMGTPEGSPVPMSGGFLKDKKGAIVVPKLDALNLQQTALSGNGIYVGMQAGDADINRLSKLFNSKHAGLETEKLELTADIWREEGPWLLLLVIPFAALWSRKGWLLCLTILILPLPETSYAFEMSDLWRNQNQRAKKELDAGNNKQAAELFEQPDWKASAYYRNGDYEQSLEILEQTKNKIPSSDTHYNKGNALAKLKRYPDAIEAYEQALELSPGNEDAEHNMKLVKEAMENQQQNSDQPSDDNEKNQDNKDQDNKDQDSQQSSNDDQKNNEQENKQDQDQQSESEDSESKQSDKDNSEQASTEDEQKNKKENKDENDQTDKEKEQQDPDKTMAENTDDKELTEEQYATEQWLRRIPDDPGGLLRRKFKYQYKNMPNKTRSDQPW